MVYVLRVLNLEINDYDEYDSNYLNKFTKYLDSEDTNVVASKTAKQINQNRILWFRILSMVDPPNLQATNTLTANGE
jgi:hypothetical protein